MSRSTALMIVVLVEITDPHPSEEPALDPLVGLIHHLLGLLALANMVSDRADASLDAKILLCNKKRLSVPH